MLAEFLVELDGDKKVSRNVADRDLTVEVPLSEDVVVEDDSGITPIDDDREDVVSSGTIELATHNELVVTGGISDIDGASVNP